jgi:hypothetical protein
MRAALASAFIVLLVIAIWMLGPMMREPDPVSLTPDQLAQMNRMLAIPDRTPDEWQAACAIPYDFGPSERGSGRCSMQVIVDCPPDCGVYKTLQEDKLLRRIW